MQYNLTKLHEQFQQKHNQLSEISEKIDTFMQLYKPKIDGKISVKCKLKKLADGLKNIKEEFKVVKNDLVTYGQLPNQFVRMVVQLPGIYQGFWENRQAKLRRNLQTKDDENQMLKQKLSDKDQQINQLKLRLALKEKQIQYQKIIEGAKSGQNLNADVKNEPKGAEINAKSKSIQKEEDDLDQYINNMEITIKEHDDPLFKKITQHESQEQQEQETSNISSRNDRKNNTARSNLFLDCSDDAIKVEPIRKRSECSFLQQTKCLSKNSSKNLSKPEELISKCTFWNKLSKNLNSTTKSKKSLSRSKENIENREANKINKFSVAEKKILTSKITDFRKLLFVQKGIQRFSFKVDNCI